MPPTGEQVQHTGAEGAQRAKRWLESTCRAEVKWNNPTLNVKKLQFRKAGAPVDSEAMGDYFSFDLGGTLLGGDHDGQVFLAECKHYAGPADQGTEYRAFLANCYRVESEFGTVYDNFMWITWAPFLVNTWNQLMLEATISTAISSSDAHKYTALGTTPYDPAIGNAVASKLLLVVLADGQEQRLSLQGAELLHVRKALLEIRGQS